MKSQTIRNAFISLVMALICLPVTSQYMWSTPQPITDSMADNRNAMVAEIQFNGTFDQFVFWERSNDLSATAIYYKRLYEVEEPVALLETPGVHYRNVQVISTYWYNSDTNFYLFYESDQNGNFDIYYLVYTPLGFGDPVLFAGTPEDDTHFRCSPGGGMVWLEGDQVRYSELQWWNPPIHFTDPVTVDSADCTDPVIEKGDYGYVAWLKSVDGNEHIYYSQFWGSSWTEPQLLYDIGTNYSLRFSSFACSWDIFGGVLVWDNIFEGVHTIVSQQIGGDEFIAGFSQEGAYMPDISEYTFPVDNYLYESYMTFANLEEGNGDIFVSDWNLAMGISPYIEEYVDISNTPCPETNPQFFNGRCYWEVCDLVDVWESYRSNGHWQLYYSINGEIGCYGETREIEAKFLDLQLSPNPASSSCDISYTLPGDEYISLSLINPLGQQFKVFEKKFQDQGEHTVHLEFSSIFSGTLKPGIYLVRLQTGNRVEIRKLVIDR